MAARCAFMCAICCKQASAVLRKAYSLCCFNSSDGKCVQLLKPTPGKQPRRSADRDRASAARLEQIGKGGGGGGVFREGLGQGGLQRLRVLGLLRRAFDVGDGLCAGGARQLALDPAPDGLDGVGGGFLGGVLAEIEAIGRNERNGGGESHGVHGRLLS